MRKCGLPVSFCLIKKKQKRKTNVQVNFSVILSASIYLTIRDQHGANFPVMFLKQVRGDMYTLNGPSIHWNLLTLCINPRENDQQHIKNLKKHLKHVRVRIHPLVQNTLSLQYTFGKPQKKTIKTMYASCYTERHSVWYVVYYCKHILTDICYRVERKGQLCPQMAILSCTFVTLNVVQEVYATGLKKPLFQDSLKWGITKAYWGSV